MSWNQPHFVYVAEDLNRGVRVGTARDLLGAIASATIDGTSEANLRLIFAEIHPTFSAALRRRRRIERVIVQAAS